MSKINVSVNTTPKQDVQLAQVLEEVNRQRVAVKPAQPEFLDFNAYATFALEEVVGNLLKQHGAFVASQVANAFNNSHDAAKDEIKRLLGL